MKQEKKNIKVSKEFLDWLNKRHNRYLDKTIEGTLKRLTAYKEKRKKK